MRPGYGIVNNDTPFDFEYKDKTIVVINWLDINTVYIQSIYGETVDHMAEHNIVAFFKIKYK